MSKLLDQLKAENRRKEGREKEKEQRRLEKQEQQRIKHRKEQKMLEQQRGQRDLHKRDLIKSGLCNRFLQYAEEVVEEFKKTSKYKESVLKHVHLDGNESHFSVYFSQGSRKKNLSVEVGEKGVYLDARIVQTSTSGSSGRVWSGTYISGNRTSSSYDTYRRKIYIDPSNFSTSAMDTCLRFVCNYIGRLPFLWGRFTVPS